MYFLSFRCQMKSLYERLLEIKAEYVWHSSLPPGVSPEPDRSIEEVMREYEAHPGWNRVANPVWKNAQRKLLVGLDGGLTSGLLAMAGMLLAGESRGYIYGVVVPTSVALGFGYSFGRAKSDFPPRHKQRSDIDRRR